MQRNTLALGGVVLFGLLALIFTMMALRGGSQPAPQQAQAPVPTSVTQWVAAREIPRRTRIERAMLTPRTMEGGKALPGAITDPSEVVGKVVADTIPAGKVVTADLVTPSVVAVVPANMPVPVGFRAVAVWVNPQQTAAGLVDVGDRVDVVVNNKLKIKSTAGDVGDYTSGRTIAQYLLVLGVDRSLEASRAPAAQATPSAPGSPPPPPPPPAPPQAGEPRTRVILAAPPAVAERLVAANQQGILHIIIRNPSDRPTIPVPEAVEYPVRMAADPKIAERADKIREEARQEAKQIRQERRAEEREMRRLQMTSRYTNTSSTTRIGPMPVPNIPAPGTGGIPSAPAPSHEKEVTVIRGTEKTRVIVPNG